MRKLIKSNIVLLLIGIISISCTKKIDNNLEISETINNALEVVEDKTELRILSTELFYKYFSIELPENFEIERFNGPDFLVFYLDTAEKAIGGIYLCNYPSSVIEREHNYETDFRSTLFNKSINWKIFFNGNIYITETTVKSSGNNNWPEFIHLWFVDTSIEELKKKVSLFSTLKLK